MITHYKAAIFDLDGTLIDSLQDLWISVNHSLSQMGFPKRSLDEVRQFVGNGVGKLMQRAVPQGTDNALVEQCLQCFKQHYVKHCCENTAPYEGVVPMLRLLHQQGILTVILPNKLQSAGDELVDEHFKGIIDVVIGEREGIRRKPAPDMVDLAVQQLQLEKDDCLYIGDSDVDVQTAGNAGLDCVAVLWGFRSRDVLLQAGATRFVEHPAELLEFFGR
ncbi:MAG: HAD family hydrolase [Bacteroidaceae bacterium]|nr:HAD family hydrolase [Bacteroidaceae bacterium]